MSNNQVMRGVSEQFRAQLRSLREDLREEGADIVERHGEEAVARLEQEYPEHTGNLKKNVRKTVVRGQFGVVVTVKNTAKHAYLFEHGTQQRKTKQGFNRGIMPANDIFIPAMVRQRKAMYGDLAGLLERQGLEVTSDVA